VAALIGESRDLTDLYRQTVAKGASSTATANWIVNEVAPTGKIPSPGNLAELVRFIEDGAITRDQGREVLLESVETGRTPAEIVAEHGFRQTSDEAELRVIAEAVIDANPKAVSDYRAGKTQAIYVLVKDLRTRAPQANPKVANEVLTKLLA
jgi:aspartyl-tRNA(Asn)/glutamyl-tRNA(Gln) amidotransferase subunit B